MKPLSDLHSSMESLARDVLDADRGTEPAYVLRGLLRCAACGSTWAAGPRGPRRAPCYGCPTPACAEKPVLCTTVERAVMEALAAGFAGWARFDALEASLRGRLALLSRDAAAAEGPTAGDAVWLLGIAQDFRALWRHVAAPTRRKVLLAFVEHIAVAGEAVQVAWAVDGATAGSLPLHDTDQLLAGAQERVRVR